MVNIKVRCKTHGPMHWRPESHTYDCVGFDGEGCSAYASLREMDLILQRRPLDRVAASRFGWTLLDKQSEGIYEITIYVGEDAIRHRRMIETSMVWEE